MIDTKQNLFESSLKTLGLISVNEEKVNSINEGAYREYIKALYLPKGGKLSVDFTVYSPKQAALFFVAPNQLLQIETTGAESGYLIFYNRDFYCIQIHDNEVACDGLLFNNIHNMPLVEVDAEETVFIDYLFRQMKAEFELHDYSLEEMIRTYLKQLLIRSTRLWKKQHLDTAIREQNNALEFFRKFTLLVDAHYKKKHTVADYADLLNMAPKTITHKFKRLNLPQPNEIIKSRIVLEAKRLLVHTSMTAKEIAYELGYDDPAYFSRLFLTKTGESPSGFRTKYHEHQ
ncbi:AraC-type DNA-binding protein [Parapedobacter luteus]|uniref:AraC-type DNA-binding protein n=1 Tax=Parapedobacter luteus TaxID=623280 RepID=A0A1T5FM68_9SPHI|nr:helix-turn-helix domain-containing protein [Parapedobacter luteus]SKB97188.1 AraC-type DNA-binding protein [Parapedobacter luteus]